MVNPGDSDVARIIVWEGIATNGKGLMWKKERFKKGSYFVW